MNISHRHNKLQKEFDEYVYMVSHDLLGHVHAIKALCEWVVEDFKVGNQQDLSQEVVYLQDRSKRLNLFLESINELSKATHDWHFVKSFLATEYEKSEQLAQYEALLNEFNEFTHIVSNILHEDIRIVGVHCDILQEAIKGNDEQEIRECIAVLQHSSERLQNMLMALTEYSRIARMPEPMGEVNLYQIIQDVIDSTVTNDNVELDVIIETKQCVTTPERLKKTLSRFIDNAIRYNDKPEQKLAIKGKLGSSSFIEFEISDNGKGLSPNCQIEIFKIFNNCEQRRKMNTLGVSLPISKKMIEHYGGKLMIDSELGIGTTFRFSWPILAAIG